MSTYREVLRKIALENDGYLTPQLVEEHGVPAVELRKLAARGAFLKQARGVYRDPLYPDDAYDFLREALLSVGEQAYLRGETVLEVLSIGDFNPAKINIASPQRHRKAIPSHIDIQKVSMQELVTRYRGMRAQKAAAALREVRFQTMADRWWSAVEEAYDRGYILAREKRELELLR